MAAALDFGLQRSSNSLNAPTEPCRSFIISSNRSTASCFKHPLVLPPNSLKVPLPSAQPFSQLEVEVVEVLWGVGVLGAEVGVVAVGWVAARAGVEELVQVR